MTLGKSLDLCRHQFPLCEIKRLDKIIFEVSSAHNESYFVPSFLLMTSFCFFFPSTRVSKLNNEEFHNSLIKMYSFNPSKLTLFLSPSCMHPKMMTEISFYYNYLYIKDLSLISHLKIFKIHLNENYANPYFKTKSFFFNASLKCVVFFSIKTRR